MVRIVDTEGIDGADEGLLVGAGTVGLKVSPRLVGDGVAHSYKCVGANVVTVAGTMSVNDTAVVVVVAVVVPVVREPTIASVVVVVVPVVGVVELVPILIREPPDGDCGTSPTDSANWLVNTTAPPTVKSPR